MGIYLYDIIYYLLFFQCNLTFFILFIIFLISIEMFFYLTLILEE